MSNIETAEIIQFADARTRVGKKPASKVPQSRELPRNEDGITDTCINQRLRGDRRDVWLEADAVMDYWHAVMKMDTAISRVQRHETPEGNLHPIREPKDYWGLVANYRIAWARLMLTPAPDMRSVTWKRAELKAEKHKHTDLKTERIERAIADDVEFLKTHPTRRSGKQGMDPKKLEERRAFKAAMRARVTLYAERNGIDKSELAWLGRIKHQDLAAFADRYGLSYEWLLEGSGTEGRETPTN